MNFTLIKELSGNKKKKLEDLIKENGFKITKSTPCRIDFKKGFREFTLYSTNVEDQESGLTTYPDFDKFLTNFYKHKSKHSTSLQDKINNDKLSIDEAFDILGWKINQYFNLKDFNNYFNTEEPFAEDLYEIQIKNLSHIVIDEEVYEGGLEPLLSLGKVKSHDALTKLSNKDFVETIKNYK